MEYWSNGFKGIRKRFFGFYCPLIQYSNTPLLHVPGINLVPSKILCNRLQKFRYIQLGIPLLRFLQSLSTRHRGKNPYPITIFQDFLTPGMNPVQEYQLDGMGGDL